MSYLPTSHAKFPRDYGSVYQHNLNIPSNSEISLEYHFTAAENHENGFHGSSFTLRMPYGNLACDVDDKEVRNLVLWLEDCKIRRYKIEDRQPLRQYGPEWPSTFDRYCKDLACPIQEGSIAERLEWLLGYAVSLEYADDVEKYQGQTAEHISKNVQNVPKVESSNPLDNLDFESPEFKKGVLALAHILNVTPHPDHLVTLQAVSKVVRQRLSQEALDNPNGVIVKGDPFPIQEADLGFEMGDYILNQAAKILRLLYVHDLRDLQTRINETIVAVQNITADPKTDTKLGQVGR